MANEPQKDKYEIFMDRINVNDKVLVKAPIQNKVKEECYFLGTVINKRKEVDSPIVAIQLEGEDGIRGIRLKVIGTIENVKKTIIPMNFIFKDENIKAKKLGIPGEYDCGADKNCDGVLSDKESGMGPDEFSEVLEEMHKDNVDTEAEITVGRTKGDEALVVENIEEEQFKDFPRQGGGGKKKKKKNRSRSKKNKKKRKRKNSTKKKN
jgi:hypothetical protein